MSCGSTTPDKKRRRRANTFDLEASAQDLDVLYWKRVLSSERQSGDRETWNLGPAWCNVNELSCRREIRKGQKFPFSQPCVDLLPISEKEPTLWTTMLSSMERKWKCWKMQPQKTTHPIPPGEVLPTALFDIRFGPTDFRSSNRPKHPHGPQRPRRPVEVPLPLKVSVNIAVSGPTLSCGALDLNWNLWKWVTLCFKLLVDLLALYKEKNEEKKKGRSKTGREETRCVKGRRDQSWFCTSGDAFGEELTLSLHRPANGQLPFDHDWWALFCFVVLWCYFVVLFWFPWPLTRCFECTTRTHPGTSCVPSTCLTLRGKRQIGRFVRLGRKHNWMWLSQRVIVGILILGDWSYSASKRLSDKLFGLKTTLAISSVSKRLSNKFGLKTA